MLFDWMIYGGKSWQLQWTNVIAWCSEGVAFVGWPWSFYPMASVLLEWANIQANRFLRWPTCIWGGGVRIQNQGFSWCGLPMKEKRCLRHRCKPRRHQCTWGWLPSFLVPSRVSKKVVGGVRLHVPSGLSRCFLLSPLMWGWMTKNDYKLRKWFPIYDIDTICFFNLFSSYV